MNREEWKPLEDFSTLYSDVEVQAFGDLIYACEKKAWLEGFRSALINHHNYTPEIAWELTYGR